MTKPYIPLTIEDRTFIERSLLEGIPQQHIALNSGFKVGKIADEIGLYRQSTSVYNAKIAHYIVTDHAIKSNRDDGLSHFIFFVLKAYYHLIENNQQNSPLMDLINHYLIFDYKCRISFDERLKALELYGKYGEAKKVAPYLDWSHSALCKYIFSIKQRMFT